jgi:hypothetical protein
MSVCPSICLTIRPSVYTSAWNNTSPTGRIFMKFYFSVFFLENLSRKFKPHLNLRRIKGTLREGLFTSTRMISPWIILRISKLQTKAAQKIKTLVFCSLFFSKMCYLCDNVVKYDRTGQATDKNTTHGRCIRDN